MDAKSNRATTEDADECPDKNLGLVAEELLMDISEKNLEDTIEQVLLSNGSPTILAPRDMVLHQPRPLYGPATSNLAPDNVTPGGYHKRKSEDYDRALC